MTKEVHLAASYDELSESLQQRVELAMRFFLALGEPVDTPAAETPQQVVPLEEQMETVMDASSDTASNFEMGRS